MLGVTVLTPAACLNDRGVHAGLMNRPHTGIPGQADRKLRHEMVSIAILLTPIVVLSGAAISVALEAGRAGISNPARTACRRSCTRGARAPTTNGSRVSPASMPTPLYNLGLAVAMWLGRFGTIVPVLALAGNMALKKAFGGRGRQDADPRTAVRRAADRHGVPGRRADLTCRRSHWGRWSNTWQLFSKQHHDHARLALFDPRWCARR